MYTQAWDDAYHELWKQTAHHRGLREAIDELPDNVLSHSLRQWPRTCGVDVIAIASVIDPVLRAAPRETGCHAVERAWRRCTADLADVALDDPDREYRENRAFWSALASAAAYLTTVDATVPEAMWQALLAEVASPVPAHRNMVTEASLHLAAFSYDELWRDQKAALAKLRGADVRDSAQGVMGGRITIPRTTNADVLQLATYWIQALAEVERKRRQLDPHGPQALHAAGLDGEIERWNAVLINIDIYAKAGEPDAVYPRNEEFWRASASLAVTVAAIDEAPPPFEMLLDTLHQHLDVGHRNATYPGEGPFESTWDQQRDDSVQARGFDMRDAPPGRTGRPMKIPRTLNAEVTKLADYWDAAWRKLEGRRGLLGDLPTEQGLDGLKKRWQAAMKNVNETAKPGKVDDVYPMNHEFWRESFELARTLDDFNEIPTKLDIALDVAKKIPDRFANVVGQISHAVGDIAQKAGEGVLSGLGKPILIGGGAILGGLLLWRFARSRPRAAEAA